MLRVVAHFSAIATQSAHSFYELKLTLMGFILHWSTCSNGFRLSLLYKWLWT